MALTRIISARVDRKTYRRLSQEAREQSKAGAKVDGADITRNALIEYFDRKDKARCLSETPTPNES